MGGFGSGRWPDIINRKIPVELCRCLSIKQLKDADFLADGRSGEITWVNSAGVEIGRINLVVSGDRHGVLSLKCGGQVIEFERTPCHYGGWRFWFLCPGGCRATKLYLPLGAGLFGCRNCYDLSRLSVQENHKRDRLASHIEKADLENLSISQAMRLGGL